MWFSALLRFVAEVDGRNVGEQEESVRLFRADSEESARLAAAQLGRAEQRDYLNHVGQTVVWRFVEAIEIQALLEPELYDGVEVFSRTTCLDS